jgi:hypothetical protein
MRATAVIAAIAMLLVGSAGADAGELGAVYLENGELNAPQGRPAPLIYPHRYRWIVTRSTDVARRFFVEVGPLTPYWCEVHRQGGMCAVWAEQWNDTWFEGDGIDHSIGPVQIFVAVWRCRDGVRAWDSDEARPRGCKPRFSLSSLPPGDRTY